MALAIEQVLAALEARKVRYLVVGGVAVVLHGHLRTTADLDLVVGLAPENALRAIGALQGLGFHPRAPVPAEQFADAAARRRWIGPSIWPTSRRSSRCAERGEGCVDPKGGQDGFPRGFDGHRRAQAALGLRLTPAERLRWLEETMAVLRRWRGRARGARPVGDADGE